MNNFHQDFGPFEHVIWINSAHQGALPKTAVARLKDAISWKVSPVPLADSNLFSDVPAQLRIALGKLINAPAKDIILGNSASYGMHILANGIDWKPGDEVLVVKGDFPATILPWLGLADRGVHVKTVEMVKGRLSAEELSRNIGHKTRVFCSSWVFSFYGLKIDLPSISRVCKEKNVKLVVNGSQALGTEPLDITDGHVDAITSTGFKWLCGPYGTGFCWVDPAWRDSFKYNQAYWLSMQIAEELQTAQDMPQIKKDLGARKYDVFGTANFFNFVPWTASINYLLDAGIHNIKTHNDALVSRLIEGLDSDCYDIISPLEIENRSSILIVTHKKADTNLNIFECLRKNQVYISLRNGRLRFAPHLYNTEEHIDQALEIMNTPYN